MAAEFDLSPFQHLMIWSNTFSKFLYKIFQLDMNISTMNTCITSTFIQQLLIFYHIYFIYLCYIYAIYIIYRKREPLEVTPSHHNTISHVYLNNKHFFMQNHNIIIALKKINNISLISSNIWYTFWFLYLFYIHSFE